jgi:crotonobetainyl-CoA:carnitine CoA-transferase CaiB-like acyl-CoA transferase
LYKQITTILTRFFQKRKKDIIIVRMSAMGQSGPWRNFAALGPTIQALSGITYLTSMTEEKPVGIGYAYSDTVAGLYAAFVILAALEHRDKTGQGICIDLSELEAMASLIGPALMQASATGTGPSPCANKPAGTPAAPYGCFRCSGDDRWCVIAVFTEEQWRALCTILDMQEAADEFRFSTLSSRLLHMDEINRLVESRTRIVSAEDIVSSLQQAGIPAGIVRNAPDIANDNHLIERGFFADAFHPVLGRMRFDTTPIHLPDTPADSWKPAPMLGQDNDYVFRELLDMDYQTYSLYKQKGIIA